MLPATAKILIVDDMSTMRKLITRALKEIGYSDLTEAPGGQEAWNLISEGRAKYDLVVSDWNMPGVTGIELLRRVRGHEVLKATPFILLTAESEEQQIIQAVRAGVSGYVVKPFTVVTLKAQLSKLAAA